MADQKEYYRKYYREHKEEYKNRNREHKRERAEYFKTYQPLAYAKTKTEIFELLGNKCVRCGFSDPRALQIDHINGHGKKEIRSFICSREYYKYVLKQLKQGSKVYQLLCANCNWIKRHENKE